MRVITSVVDQKGYLHTLCIMVEQAEENGQIFSCITKEKTLICVYDVNGEEIETLDVTDIFREISQRPYCMDVDANGNYYFDNESEIIQIDSNGKLAARFSCDGIVDGIGTGRSGTIYCTYYVDGESSLAKLEEGSVITVIENLPKAAASYGEIYPGADAELLLLNKDSGIFAYTEGGIEERISSADYPVSGQNINGWGVLGDGRVCILTSADDIVFYYLPTAK